MSNSESYAGFNLTSSKLQFVEIAVSDNHIELVNIDEVYLNEDINFEKDKISKIGALIQSAYQEILLNTTANPKFSSFCLPLDLFSSAQLPLDRRLSTDEALEDYKFQFSILFPYLDDDLIIKFYEVDKNQLNKHDSAIVIGLEKKYLELIDNFAKDNELKLLFVDNPHTASNLSLFSSNSILCKGYHINIYIQKKIISYSISFNQQLLKMKVFNYNRIGDIPEILNNEFYNEIFSKIDSESISASFISGDEVSSNLVSLLRKSMNIDFMLFNPFEKLNVRKDLYENKIFLKKYNSFSPALGIALRLN
jgi:Tfp pilus assembly PilM family ATPase